MRNRLTNVYAYHPLTGKWENTWIDLFPKYRIGDKIIFSPENAGSFYGIPGMGWNPGTDGFIVSSNEADLTIDFAGHIQNKNLTMLLKIAGVDNSNNPLEITIKANGRRLDVVEVGRELREYKISIPAGIVDANGLFVEFIQPLDSWQRFSLVEMQIK